VQKYSVNKKAEIYLEIQSNLALVHPSSYSTYW